MLFELFSTLINCFSPFLASFFISIKPEETAIVLNQKSWKSHEQKATFKDVNTSVHQQMCHVYQQA